MSPGLRPFTTRRAYEQPERIERPHAGRTGVADRPPDADHDIAARSDREVPGHWRREREAAEGRSPPPGSGAGRLRDDQPHALDRERPGCRLRTRSARRGGASACFNCIISPPPSRRTTTFKGRVGFAPPPRAGRRAGARPRRRRATSARWRGRTPTLACPDGGDPRREEGERQGPCPGQLRPPPRRVPRPQAQPTGRRVPCTGGRARPEAPPRSRTRSWRGRRRRAGGAPSSRRSRDGSSYRRRRTIAR